MKTNYFIYEILIFTETKIQILFTFLPKMTIDQFEIRLLVALLLGAVIGLEREWQQKIAGIRTNALVALGAALFVLLGNKISGDSSSTARIVSQIVSGIGFLGAGAIMKEGLSVSGINTAATIWCSGAVGSLAGMGWLYEGSVAACFIVATHFILRPISHKIDEYAEKSHGKNGANKPKQETKNQAREEESTD